MAKTIAFTDLDHAAIIAAARAAGRFVGRGTKSQLGAFVVEAARAFQPKPARKRGRGVAATRRRVRPNSAGVK